MNKKVVAVIVVVLAAAAIWYGWTKMQPYLASPPPEVPMNEDPAAPPV